MVVGGPPMQFQLQEPQPTKQPVDASKSHSAAALKFFLCLVCLQALHSNVEGSTQSPLYPCAVTSLWALIMALLIHHH